jgi:hypothetical protein
MSRAKGVVAAVTITMFRNVRKHSRNMEIVDRVVTSTVFMSLVTLRRAHTHTPTHTPYAAHTHANTLRRAHTYVNRHRHTAPHTHTYANTHTLRRTHTYANTLRRSHRPTHTPCAAHKGQHTHMLPFVCKHPRKRSHSSLHEHSHSYAKATRKRGPMPHASAGNSLSTQSHPNNGPARLGDLRHAPVHDAPHGVQVIESAGGAQ